MQNNNTKIDFTQCTTLNSKSAKGHERGQRWGPGPESIQPQGSEGRCWKLLVFTHRVTGHLRHLRHIKGNRGLRLSVGAVEVLVHEWGSAGPKPCLLDSAMPVPRPGSPSWFKGGARTWLCPGLRERHEPGLANPSLILNWGWLSKS